MSIEKNLERIADALEAIVQSQGIVAGTTPAPETKDTPTPRLRKKDKTQVVGKPDANLDLDLETDDEPTLQDVRTILKLVREQTSHAQVKSILKSFGASTLKQMNKKNYAAAIAAAEKAME